MLKLKWIISFSFESSHQLFWHPFNLWLCKFNYVETNVITKSKRICHQSRFFVLPQLVKHVRKFQNSASSVYTYQNISSISHGKQNICHELFISRPSRVGIVMNVVRICDEQRGSGDLFNVTSINRGKLNRRNKRQLFVKSCESPI